MSRRLYFKTSRNTLRPIAIVHDQEDASKEINKFLNEHNYKSYYTRTWNIDDTDVIGITVFDVGSWTEFFYLYPENTCAKVCGECRNYAGGGDWNLCCSKKYDLCYVDTDAKDCKEFELNE